LTYRVTYDTAGRYLVDCRHGYALFADQQNPGQCIQWDPYTTDHNILPIPAEFMATHPYQRQWAMLCPKDDQGNVHRLCKDNAPMKVFLVANKPGQPNKIIGSVYSNKTAVWSDVSTTDAVRSLESIVSRPSLLAGNTIHWLIGSREEIQFDLDTHRLSWIKIEFLASSNRRMAVFAWPL
jgi:hypothetical protein